MLSDLEISRALARAIGWSEDAVYHNLSDGCVEIITDDDGEGALCCKRFDYRDWDVIAPIAEQYDCFPYRGYKGEWVATGSWWKSADTPQKAIALAVIQSAAK